MLKITTGLLCCSVCGSYDIYVGQKIGPFLSTSCASCGIKSDPDPPEHDDEDCRPNRNRQVTITQRKTTRAASPSFR
jgi:hypothetical protein